MFRNLNTKLLYNTKSLLSLQHYIGAYEKQPHSVLLMKCIQYEKCANPNKHQLNLKKHCKPKLTEQLVVSFDTE